MDKLEKALEKSRQLREAYTGTPTRPSQSSAPLQSASMNASTFTSVNELIDDEQMDSNRIIAHHARSHEADIYRQLRTKVLQIMEKSGFKTLAITSPRYGDGKTTVAINLGISIAQDLKQTVLLVDLDLRKPNLDQYLGVESGVGLTDYLLKNVPLSECLARPPFERLNTLPAGSALDKSSEILGSPKMATLAKEIRSRYPDRLVIYDMPPVLTQDDSIAFLPQVDAVLVVVRDGVTRTEDLKRCVHALSGANVIGTVLNNAW